MEIDPASIATTPLGFGPGFFLALGAACGLFRLLAAAAAGTPTPGTSSMSSSTAIGSGK